MRKLSLLILIGLISTFFVFPFALAEEYAPVIVDMCDIREKASTPVAGLSYLANRENGLVIDTIVKIDISHMKRTGLVENVTLSLYSSKDSDSAYIGFFKADDSLWGDGKAEGEGISFADAPEALGIICNREGCSHNPLSDDSCNGIIKGVSKNTALTVDITDYIKEALDTGRRDVSVIVKSMVTQADTEIITFYSTTYSTTTYTPSVSYRYFPENIDNTLKSISFEGAFLNRAFNRDVTDYIVVCEQGSIHMPVMSYELNDEFSSVENITEAEEIGETTSITIIAENGEMKTYNFTFRYFDDMGYSENGKTYIEKTLFISEGEKIENIIPDMNVSTITEVLNENINPCNLVYVTVLKKDGRMIDVSAKNYTLSTGINTLDSEISIPSESGNYSVEVFFWDDINSRVPVAEKACVGLEYGDNKSEKTVNIFVENKEESIIDICGKLNSSENLSVAIFKEADKDYEYQSIDSYEILSKTIYFGQIKTDNEGYYSLHAGMPEESGFYFIKFSDGTNKRFFYSIPDERRDTVSQLLDYENEDDFIEKMLNKDGDNFLTEEIIGINTDELNVKNKNKAYNILYSMLKNNEESDFYTLLELSYTIQMLNEGSVNDVSEYSSEFGLDEAAVELYGRFEEKLKKEISSLVLSGKDFADICDINEEFVDAVIVALANNPKNRSNITDLIKNWNNVIGMSESEYKNYISLGSSGASKVAARVIDAGPYSSKEELKVSIIKQISVVKSAGSNTAGGGIGGGGGGNTLKNNPGFSVEVRGEKIENEAPLLDIIGKKVSPFIDLSGYEWAKDAILSLYEKGIVHGTGKETFEPSREITREEFLKLVISALEIPLNGENAEFSDVDENAWYFPYVATGSANGIISGTGNNMFGTGKPIIRQDMAVIAFRAMEEKTENAHCEYADSAEISDYAIDAIAYFTEKEVLKGTGENFFNPTKNVTRAEAAKFICNLLALR